MKLMAGDAYWETLEKLVANSRIVIDRPKGSRHPRFPEMIYPLDYGFLEDTTGNDGAEADVWRGTLPGDGITGVVCTVDLMKRDAEVKILIGCTPQEIEIIHAFYNTGSYMSGMTVVR
jgi:inorganic pyrophosphatase